jgi:MFS transporter, SP family, arabinose:H+ symporter
MANKHHRSFFLPAVIASLGGFLFGYDTAVISGTVGSVKAQFGLDEILEGWYVSSALLGCIFGVSIAGFLSDRFGRKRVLLLSGLLFTLSAAGCALAPSFGMLIAYRLVGGMGVGIASMASPLYISELSPPAVRGRMVALYQLAITVGILSAYFVNAWILRGSQKSEWGIEDGLMAMLFRDEWWRGMLGAETLPAILFLLLLLLVPESPRWLIVRGRESEGLRVLSRFTDPRLLETQVAEIRAMAVKAPARLKTILQPGLRRAVAIGVLLALFTQFSGINAIIYYGPRILEEAGFRISEALGGQVFIGIVNVLFTFVAILYIDRLGRRPLLIWGVSGILLALAATGGLFYAGVIDGPWLLLSILAFIACFAFSFGPVTWVITSEIFPTRIRGRAMSITTMATWISTALVGQMVPWLLITISPAGTFWLFALLCSPALYLGLRLLPETKGKSLEEIERFWVSSRS